MVVLTLGNGSMILFSAGMDEDLIRLYGDGYPGILSRRDTDRDSFVRVRLRGAGRKPGGRAEALPHESINFGAPHFVLLSPDDTGSAK